MYNKEAFLIFKKLEFKNFLNRFQQEETVENMEKKHYVTLRDPKQVEQVFHKCSEKRFDRTAPFA
jgi:hypothetical protein